MRYTTGFVNTLKESGHDVESKGHDLSLRAGLISPVVSGFYHFLPLGTRVLRKIETIIRNEMNNAGASEILMPIMQPADLWKESRRWDVYGQELFKLKGRTEREFCLGPTHEELIIDLVRSRVCSYKDLPFILYQFGTKFRDEKRPRGGLLRTREFLMKDAYSFDISDDGLNISYENMKQTYLRILERVSVRTIPISANTGEIGGRFSEEFIAPSPFGEDKFVMDDNGKAKKVDSKDDKANGRAVQNGIEICHIFKLGTNYSTIMNLRYVDAHGNQKPVVMGCYGIGTSRMLPTIIEQNYDEKGIIWPIEVAPFEAVVIPTHYDDPEIRQEAERIYLQFRDKGIDILIDDRDVSPGVKFNDADLIGLPYKLIVGKRTIKTRQVECEKRQDGTKITLDLESVLEQYFNRIRNSY